MDKVEVNGRLIFSPLVSNENPQIDKAAEKVYGVSILRPIVIVPSFNGTSSYGAGLSGHVVVMMVL
ncbi:hypothetical protein SESBI_03072 [Sesbania bispinosa]|nr:hypothetical protein SESBI_03072 [Sesbania bispinosa]